LPPEVRFLGLNAANSVGAYSACKWLDLAGFKGPTSKKREGMGEERKGRGGDKGREGRGRRERVRGGEGEKEI